MKNKMHTMIYRISIVAFAIIMYLLPIGNMRKYLAYFFFAIFVLNEILIYFEKRKKLDDNSNDMLEKNLNNQKR